MAVGCSLRVCEGLERDRMEEKQKRNDLDDQSMFERIPRQIGG
jgi:hypothetical protein